MMNTPRNREKQDSQPGPSFWGIAGAGDKRIQATSGKRESDMNTIRSILLRGLAPVFLAIAFGLPGEASAAHRGKQVKHSAHSGHGSSRSRHANTKSHHDKQKRRRKMHNRKIIFNLLFGSVQRHKHVTRQWVPGRYEMRVERILAEAGHYKCHYIAAVVETRYNAAGRPYTAIVQPARTEKHWISPRYEMRELQTWIPGYWVEQVTYSSGSQPGLSALFRF